MTAPMAAPTIVTVGTVILAVIVAMTTAIVTVTPTAMIIPTMSAAEMKGHAISPAISHIFDGRGRVLR